MERAEWPFAWGTHDCCITASDLWLAQTGFDPMAGLRGYDSQHGALRMLRVHVPLGTPRTRRLELLAATRFSGFTEYPPLYARRGFIVLVPVAGDDALGVVDLTGTAIIVPAMTGGWATAPLAAGRRAWGIA